MFEVLSNLISIYGAVDSIFFHNLMKQPMRFAAVIYHVIIVIEWMSATANV